MNFLRGIGLAVFVMALVAILIPHPELKWYSLGALALILFLTLPQRRDRSRAKPRRERGY